MTLDTQAIEILGRNQLVSELIRAGLEVAFPVRDRGIDLIAYRDRSTSSHGFSAVPIQMKGAVNRSFMIDKKYEKIPQLLIAYVWGIQDEKHETFVLSYGDALKIATELGYTETDSWTQNGRYASTSPSASLVGMIRKFQMTPERWQERLANDPGTTKHQ